MNGEGTLYKALSTDTNVTDLLSSVNGNKCISVGIREPETWLPENVTVSIYNTSGMDARDKRMIVDLTVNCRAGTEDEVKELATAVVDSVNGSYFLDGRGRYYCQYGGVIQPQDETDSFNLPVSIVMKAGEVVI